MRLLCVCPGCHEVFWQEARDASDCGPARVIPGREVGLLALAEEAGLVVNGRATYRRVVCSSCAVRSVKGPNRERWRAALSVGETRTGTRALL